MYFRFSNIIILCLLFNLISTFTYSQKKSKKGKDNIDTLTKNIPEKYLAYPAVIIYQKRKVIIAPNVTNEVNKIRLKILSKEGIDMFSVVENIKTKKQKLRKLSGRTLKQDGRIIPIDINDVKYTDIDINSGAKPNFEVMKFIIPNVEVGDEIEYSIEMQTPDVIPGIDIVMFNKVPTLYSEFTFETRDRCIISYSTKNGMPDAGYGNDYNNEYVWKLSELPALVFDEPYSLIYSEIPYISFVVRQGIKENKSVTINPSTWEGIYKKIKKDYANKNYELAYNNININNWLDSLIKLNANLKKEKVIETIVQYMYDSLEIVSEYPNYKSVPAYQYILEKKIDENNYFNIIDHLFKKLELNYYIGCAANKYEGFIAENFPSIHNLSNKFILFESSDNQLHYIHLPLYNTAFRFDELPYTILGTNSVIIKELETNTKYQIVNFKIPQSNYIENLRIADIKINHSLKNNESKILITEKFIGDFNTLFDQLFKQIVKKEKSKKDFINLWNSTITDLDSVNYINTVNSYPYTSELKYSYKKTDLISSIGNNNYSINITDIINHYTIYTSSYDRQFPMALPFPFKDEFNVEIFFDKEIKLESELNSIPLYFNYMDYSITVEKGSSKSIKIKSIYLIEKTIFTAQSNINIHKCNEKYSNAINNKIIVSTITPAKPKPKSKK